MRETVPVDPLSIRPLDHPPDTTVVLPGSKSITNRALVTAALASGETRLSSALFADDTLAMIDGLGALGVSCVPDSADGSITVEGRGADFAERTGSGEARVDARRSGTTSRFLMPVAALRGAPTVIDGDRQLRGRPMGHQIDALRHLGVSVEELGLAGRLPVRVAGPITGRSCSIEGDASSQFASGLLLAGGVSGLSLELAADPVSRPYLEMTVAVMRSFGSHVDLAEPQSPAQSRVLTVSGGYESPGAYAIEPDASTASYFLAAAAITGGRVRVEGLGNSSIQGDVAFADVLARMGAEVEYDDAGIEVSGGELRGVEVDLGDISDTAPTLAVVAAFASGATTVSGIGFVRHKESDRVAGPVHELRRCGIDAEQTSDGFVVRPQGPPVGAVFETYQDHRMAMAFALIGLVVEGVSICDPGCVAKTFPGYFGALEQLR
ncbi:MAG: 3-phosphoshikimate 1-carboxyvinyltransferase [Acidimicrobiaceae bacterium]|nr:3-phosphoshikimate 1-carboxyvinyltransferase [Acidimicrobiaceae bacterium]